MESFILKGENGYIKIGLEQVFDFPNTTCNWGGYDAIAKIEIKSGNFNVNSSFYTSTGEIYLFYKSLKESNTYLSGQVTYKNYEENTLITLTYNNIGQVVIEGTFSELNQFNNKLDFEINSDQSYIKYTINDLENIIDKYGDMKGINDK